MFRKKNITVNGNKISGSEICHQGDILRVFFTDETYDTFSKIKDKKVKIKNLWVVNQYANEYNPVLYHDGDIFGVGYLKFDERKNLFRNFIKLS